MLVDMDLDGIGNNLFGFNFQSQTNSDGPGSRPGHHKNVLNNIIKYFVMSKFIIIFVLY